MCAKTHKKKKKIINNNVLCRIGRYLNTNVQSVNEQQLSKTIKSYGRFDKITDLLFCCCKCVCMCKLYSRNIIMLKIPIHITIHRVHVFSVVIKIVNTTIFFFFFYPHTILNTFLLYFLRETYTQYICCVTAMSRERERIETDEVKQQLSCG